MITSFIFLTACAVLIIHSAPVPGCKTYFAYKTLDEDDNYYEEKKCEISKSDIAVDGTITLDYMYQDEPRHFVMEQIKTTGVFYVSN